MLPIFLHVGIIHLLVNMFGQLVAGSQIEREMGECKAQAFDWKLTQAGQEHCRSSLSTLAGGYTALSSEATSSELVSLHSGLADRSLASWASVFATRCAGAETSQNACVAVDLALHWRYEDRPKLRVSCMLDSSDSSAHDAGVSTAH